MDGGFYFCEAHNNLIIFSETVQSEKAEISVISRHLCRERGRETEKKRERERVLRLKKRERELGVTKCDPFWKKIYTFPRKNKTLSCWHQRKVQWPFLPIIQF